MILGFAQLIAGQSYLGPVRNPPVPALPTGAGKKARGVQTTEKVSNALDVVGKSR